MVLSPRDTFLCKIQFAIIIHFLTISLLPYCFRKEQHPSKSEQETHYTVDAYGSDENGIEKPIGCIHVFGDGRVELFDMARGKAEKVSPLHWVR